MQLFSLLQIHEMLFNYTTKLPVFICFHSIYHESVRGVREDL